MEKEEDDSAEDDELGEELEHCHNMSTNSVAQEEALLHDTSRRKHRLTHAGCILLLIELKGREEIRRDNQKP